MAHSARLTCTSGSRSAGGFTLVELLLVLVIAAFALSMVGTSISRNISGAEMRNAAGKVAAGLRYSRTKAILDKKETVFEVNIEEKSYKAADRPSEHLPEEMELELYTARSEMTSEEVGGIRFFPDGGSTGGNLKLEGNGRIYQINVTWLTGQASVAREESD